MCILVRGIARITDGPRWPIKWRSAIFKLVIGGRPVGPCSYHQPFSSLPARSARFPPAVGRRIARRQLPARRCSGATWARPGSASRQWGARGPGAQSRRAALRALKRAAPGRAAPVPRPKSVETRSATGTLARAHWGVRRRRPRPSSGGEAGPRRPSSLGGRSSDLAIEPATEATRYFGRSEHHALPVRVQAL